MCFQIWSPMLLSGRSVCLNLIQYVWWAQRSKSEKPRDLCKVSRQSSRNFQRFSQHKTLGIFHMRQQPSGVIPQECLLNYFHNLPSNKWLECQASQLRANCRQDCGAKTDALGEWQGSTKFGGEPLGEKTPQRGRRGWLMLVGRLVDDLIVWAGGVSNFSSTTLYSYFVLLV